MTDPLSLETEWAIPATYEELEALRGQPVPEVVEPRPLVEPDGAPRSTWATEIDVTFAYDPDVHRLEASVLQRDDGHGAFYEGAVNTLIGESEAAKTWVKLAAHAEQLALGHHTVAVDLEDTALGIGLRLRDLGVPLDHLRRFHYVNPTGWPDVDGFLWAFEGFSPTLVSVDAMTTGLGEAGLDPNRDVEVVRWMDAFARPVARTGPCVVVVDHVGKDATKGARGSAAKRESVTGSQIIAVKRALAAPGKRGVTSLIVGKDRGGAVRSVSQGGTHFADFVIDASSTGSSPPIRTSLVSPLPDAQGAALSRVARAIASLAATEEQPVTTKQVQQATARTAGDGDAASSFLSTRRVQECLGQLLVAGEVGRRDSGRVALWWLT